MSVSLGFIAALGWWLYKDSNLPIVQKFEGPVYISMILFGVVLFVLLLLWFLPRWQAAQSRGASASSYFNRENEARKTLAQIVGGMLLLAGLYSSVKTFNLQREGQITERYTKAIEQLGALAPNGELDVEGRPKINLEVRLGGIYALERIARDSAKDHWTIMEVLTTYVRQNSPVKVATKLAEGKRSQTATRQTRPVELEKEPTIRADIQTILTVISRRDKYRDPQFGSVDLSASNVSGANLYSANLSWADFSGSDLSGTNLRGADLSETLLDGAHLKGSYLNGAHLIEAQFSGADLMGASLTRAHLDGANFVGANLMGADLRWTNFNSSNLDSANLSGAYLNGADLRGAKHLTPSQLLGSRGDKETKLPPELERFRPASWDK